MSGCPVSDEAPTKLPWYAADVPVQQAGNTVWRRLVYKYLRQIYLNMSIMSIKKWELCENI